MAMAVTMAQMPQITASNEIDSNTQHRIKKFECNNHCVASGKFDELKVQQFGIETERFCG